MKNKIFPFTFATFVAAVLLFSTRVSAQVLYGLTSAGGDYLAGTIFSITPSGDFKTFASLNPTFAATPYGSLLYASDNNFYASSVDGGYGGSCTIFKCDHNGMLTTMINLDSVWGSSEPQGNSLLQAMDGNLYGMTTMGGPNTYGVIFKLQLSGQYSALHFFNDTDGATPYGSLIQTKDGNLWGMTSGGRGDSLSLGYGNIFRCTPSGVYTPVFYFNDSDGATPYGDLLLANDGNFYGLTSAGGLYGTGVLFRYSPTSNTYTKLVDFNGTNGAYPTGSLIQATDGKLYGLTSGQQYYYSYYPDSTNGSYSTLFSCTLSGNLTTLVYFNDSINGLLPLGTLSQASDGNLYGMTSYGGKYNLGTIFQYSLSNHFNKLVDFSGETGYNPMYGKLIEVDNLPAGLTEISHIQGTGLFPNPNNGQFTVRLSANSNYSSMEVYNTLGQKVFTSALQPGIVDNSINLSSEPNGVYLYRVLDATGNIISNGKFVIQK